MGLSRSCDWGKEKFISSQFTTFIKIYRYYSFSIEFVVKVIRFIVLKNSLIMYGGTTVRGDVDELWSFDTVLKTWTQISLSSNSDEPLVLTGHTATVVGNKMVVLLGYGSSLAVQELDLGKPIRNSKTVFEYYQ